MHYSAILIAFQFFIEGLKSNSRNFFFDSPLATFTKDWHKQEPGAVLTSSTASQLRCCPWSQFK